MTLSPGMPGTTSRRHVLAGLGLAAALLAVDQATKWWVLESLRLPDLGSVSVTGLGPFGLDLTMVWNRGISFGLLASDGPAGQAALAVLAAGILAFLCWSLWRSETRTVALGLGAIIGGAVGNIVDRVRFGAVVDFVHLSAWGWDWYVFNVADAAIVVGWAVMAWGLMRERLQAKA